MNVSAPRPGCDRAKCGRGVPPATRLPHRPRLDGRTKCQTAHPKILNNLSGGEGIRTPGGLASTAVFKVYAAGGRESAPRCTRVHVGEIMGEMTAVRVHQGATAVQKVAVLGRAHQVRATAGGDIRLGGRRTDRCFAAGVWAWLGSWASRLGESVRRQHRCLERGVLPVGISSQQRHSSLVALSMT